jgi:hypothetical protein
MQGSVFQNPLVFTSSIVQHRRSFREDSSDPPSRNRRWSMPIAMPASDKVSLEFESYREVGQASPVPHDAIETRVGGRFAEQIQRRSFVHANCTQAAAAVRAKVGLDWAADRLIPRKIVANLQRVGELLLACLTSLIISAPSALVTTEPLLASGAYAAEVGTTDAAKDGHFTIAFSGHKEGPVDQWLQKQGFTFEKDAKKRNLLGLSVTNESLVLTANGPLSGFILNDSINIDRVRRVKIKWGVLQYPEDVTYSRGVNNEALMVYFFFGNEKVSSGHVLIPNSPYFIGLFLCQDERTNFPYKGRYFHAGGRFVCLGKPRPDEVITSEFDLESAFKSYFGKEQAPGITGIGFGVDTSKAGGNGKAAAIIKSIEFIEDERD